MTDAPAAASIAIASIETLNNLDAARADWECLLEAAPASPYQSFLVQSTWMDTVGRERGLTPFIVIARDAAGAPLALLPFAIERAGPLRIASLIGGTEANFALGLFLPNVFDAAKARQLLRRASEKSPDGPDLYYLYNAPRRFYGFDNPLIGETAQKNPSDAYGVTLPATKEELAARVSKDTRKKLRKKESALAALGPLAYEHCGAGARASEIVDALIAQKSARFAEMGLRPIFESAALRAFVQRLAAENDEGKLEVHALSVGDRIVATYAGFTRNGRFSAMLNSFDMDPAIARCSPGDLLLHALMRNLVDRGMTHFDLGAGEARYKQSVCEENIELCVDAIPASVKGRIAAPLLLQSLVIKRWLKQSPRAMKLVARLRRLR